MKVYNEDDYLMISGIQHYMFCKRQWALIHIEQQWEENLHTVEGAIMHERAHEGPLLESRKDLIISREMRVNSKTLGITGICDVVEFHRKDQDENGVTLFGKEGKFVIVPVEYKKGEPKVSDADRLQLVAQIVCLEEMLMTKIGFGYLYYGKTKRREKVEASSDLRRQLEEATEDMHKMYSKQHTPKVKWSKSCNACSLNNICVPRLLKNKNVHDYLWEKAETQS